MKGQEKYKNTTLKKEKLPASRRKIEKIERNDD